MKSEILNGKPHPIYILPGVLTVLILVIFGFAAFYYYGESFILRIFFISLIPNPFDFKIKRTES